MAFPATAASPFWRQRPLSAAYLIRSVTAGFAAILMLLFLAAALGYSGIERIHAEASSSIHSVLGHGGPHEELDRLIAQQSRYLLNRIETVLGICQVTAIACGMLTIWTVRSATREMQAQTVELNLLSWRMSREHEIVARRFSHEIHDEFGQMLIGLRMLLQHTSPSEFESRRAECIHIIDDAMGSVRELSQLLRPVVLDDFGLDEALQWMIRRMQDQSRIHIIYSSQFHGRLPEVLETQLFRIAQEALSNILRHSKASEAEIHLSAMGDWVSLTIQDNGIGFPKEPEQPSGRRGMGLIGMKARVRHVGGIMNLGNHPSGGASLVFSVPCTLATEATPLGVDDEA